jgi:hypothetical protein
MISRLEILRGNTYRSRWNMLLVVGSKESQPRCCWRNRNGRWGVAMLVTCYLWSAARCPPIAWLAVQVAANKIAVLKDMALLLESQKH